MPFNKSEFCTPFQAWSSYFVESLHIAFKLVSESDCMIKSSTSFCLSVSRMALSPALELDGGLSW